MSGPSQFSSLNSFVHTVGATFCFLPSRTASPFAKLVNPLGPGADKKVMLINKGKKNNFAFEEVKVIKCNLSSNIFNVIFFLFKIAIKYKKML